MKYAIFLCLMIVFNYSSSLFGMELYSEEGSLPLKTLISRLTSAIEENDSCDVDKCREAFTSLDVNWQKEASSLGALSWGMDSDYKKMVGAHLFWNYAINVSHQNLLRQDLSSLKTVDSAGWEEAYRACTTQVFDTVTNHVYFRLPSRICAIAISASYGNPVAQILALEMFHFLRTLKTGNLTGKEGTFLTQAHKALYYSFRDVPLMYSSLSEFLKYDTEDFVDLPKTEFNNFDALIAKSALGLPRYDVLLGDYYWRLYVETVDQEHFTKIPEYYRKAQERGDPYGTLSLANFKKFPQELNLEESYDAQKAAFLSGGFERYKFLSISHRAQLKDYIQKISDFIKHNIL